MCKVSVLPFLALCCKV